ncbi:uncharacterized protein LOC144555624 [Carex rostrata]
MEGDRSWMYDPRYVNKRMNPTFVKGVEGFLEYAFGIQENIISGDRIRCPCFKCGCTRWLDKESIGKHLMKSGFRPFYQNWFMHGEQYSQVEQSQPEQSQPEVESPNAMVDMLLDAAGPSFEWTADEPPNQQAQEFYNMMKAADEPLWDGCDKEHTVLACVTELLSIKANCGITKEGFNRIVSAVKKWLPKENRLPSNQYQCKKLVKGLVLSHVKIHACPNDCMLYYGDDNISKEQCDVCGHNRFKQGNQQNTTKRLPYKEVRYLPIGPRLLRLFLTSTTAEQMRWHKEGKREKEGVMVHPADGESWKEFNRLNPDFAADPRNVRLGFCSDGFSPFNMGGRSYNCLTFHVSGKTRGMFRSDGSSSARSHSSQSYSSMPPSTHLTEEDVERISSRLLHKMEAHIEAQVEARLDARFRASSGGSSTQPASMLAQDDEDDDGDDDEGHYSDVAGDGTA